MYSKEEILNYFNQILSISSLVLSSLLICFFIFIVYAKIRRKKLEEVFPFFKFIKKKSLFFALLFTFLATSSSLIYSEYFHIIPCSLCYFQRIFIFPQFILFLTAFLLDDNKIFIYSFYLSIIGFIIAAYHEYLQLGFAKIIPCMTGAMNDCGKPEFIYYGFVTIPFMSLVIFSSLILFSILNINWNKK